MINALNLHKLLITLPGILTAIIFHEVAHGYASYLLGDPTAKNRGRLSLNPLVHLDPLGLISMIILKFGWAKPVPINPMYYKNRKVGIIIVSLAGIFTNFMLAIFFAFLFRYVKDEIILDFLYYGMLYNVILGVFNLLPFPPLDGSKVVAAILPLKYEYLFYKYERYTYIILLFMLVTDKISSFIFSPIHFIMSALIKIAIS